MAELIVSSLLLPLALCLSIGLAAAGVIEMSERGE